MIKYVLTYEYQSCFDDGGIGHDMYWTRTEFRFEAKSKKEADEVVKEKTKQGWICSGSFCDNRGLKRFISLEEETMATLLRTLATR